MHRIDDVNATTENLFTEGDPIGGTPATKITDDWLNDLQEEVCNVIEDAGITLEKGTRDQLVSAILALAKSGTLTGYTSGAGTVAGTDTILQAIQKLNGNVALKANIANPSFTGTVTATQGTAGDAVQTLQSTHADGNPSETVHQNTYEGGGSGLVTILTIPIPTDTSVIIDAVVIAKRLEGVGVNESQACWGKCVARNVSGTVTVRGTPVIGDTGDAGVFTSGDKPTFTVSSTNILVQVELNTGNARNVRATARVYPCG